MAVVELAKLFLSLLMECYYDADRYACKIFSMIIMLKFRFLKESFNSENEKKREERELSNYDSLQASNCKLRTIVKVFDSAT